ncbi:hypothetical protein [Streptomyces sp. NBC_01716]|uniref:hypothetical protein n=1 Tax=Streptomyces sp. NBC_01716 TaxID=2975917 RepID=UPI003FCD5206
MSDYGHDLAFGALLEVEDRPEDAVAPARHGGPHGRDPRHHQRRPVRTGTGDRCPATEEAGRSPGAVRRGYNIKGSFSNGSGFLEGPPRTWVEQLTALALTQGMSTFLLYRVHSADLLRRFADEVVPAVREAVAAERR